MKRFLVLLSALPLGLAACSSPEVVAEASLEQEGSAEPLVLENLPVRLLPYDRDAIFDSLAAIADEPEPQIPPEILEQQQQVQDAQIAWQEAETRWSTVRDSLRTLSTQLQTMQQRGLRNTPQYAQAFARFGTLETEERQVKLRRDEAFARFDQLQRASLTRSDSIRVVRQAWADNAFAEFNEIVEARLTELGLEEHVDTTNARGIVVFEVPEGDWWVYGRYTMPYQELYWNLPIDVVGDSVYVHLGRENAEVRPLM